jgi:hypothetical protein
VDLSEDQMALASDESTVALEHLDDHLKAILKLKLREFVHLSPCFNNIPLIDMDNYSRSQLPEKPAIERNLVGCPNHHHRALARRRPLRPVLR